ncbi:MAG TPA: hypothetical protein VF011_01725 [Terriglobales bacterium]
MKSSWVIAGPQSVLVFILILVSGSAIGQTQSRVLRNREYRRAREQWFYKGRVAPAGHTSAEMRLRARQQKLRFHNLKSESAAPFLNSAASGWQPLGPAPLASDASGTGMQDYGAVAGRVTAVVADPADTTGNTVYIGGAYGGIWRSQNAAAGSYGNAGAVTWTPLTDNQATLATGAIALQPGNATGNLSNLILVGTGEADASRDSYYGLGFLRSTDRGNSWTLITSADSGAHPFLGVAISKIVFSTAQPNTVVAGVGFSSPGEIEGGDDLNTTPHGIYYSQDAGATWHLATVRDSGTAVAPDSPRGIVYNAGAGLFYASIRRHGFYSSSDGVTWSRIANQPGAGGLAASNCPPTIGSSSCPIVRGELAVVPGRNEMYAWFTDFNPAADPPDVDQGIWLTTDGGAHWNPISTAGIDSCGDIVAGCGTEQGEYNMTLTAVPNGTATDLYAGAVNIFKCSINVSNPNCSGNPFLNLTHAYGCPPDFASIAHVHPNQHAQDYMLLNSGSRVVMYFGNDGGVYRALDGFTGLTTGSCGGTNQFDSLNGTLGSLTQFVAISEDPNNIDVVLGGTQDNGSPATSSATSNLSWQNVNNGDGGFNAIDPGTPTSWFTSHPDVGGGQLAIEHCGLGINCHAQDFAGGLVVSSYDLQGDDGAFYFPYVLDPQASGEMLIGTCRVWQGPALGGAFSVLSNNFETGTQTTCLGSEANTVTAIAAGGGKTTSGFSKVVYATTAGLGPLTTILGMPAGGHVFATTDSSTTLMSDVTGSMNPIHYPVSGVAMDSSDPSGLTAYVTVMGFGTPHVFKTINAGASWSDYSGTGLPDIPVNAVLVDGQAGMVYVGTDIGVFGSSTASAVWTEVGPASGTGSLPTTAVFDLKLFRGGGQAFLRAATHGRGVWQIAVQAGYQIAISNSPRTIFPTQQAKFNGTLTALGGYASSVTLSCTAGATSPPATCTPSPSSLTPTSSGAPFQVTASDVVGDYIFNIHGVGSDTHQVTQDQSVTLHVVDFTLGAPSPSSVTANRPNNSDAATFLVSALGSFNQTVQLSCTGLPSGATCNFSPSNSVNPVAGSPVSVTLIIGTSPSTPTGTYTITIKGTTTSPNATKSQTLGLTVTALPDYVLTISNSPQSAWVNQTATFNGKLTAANGYNAPVNLSCAAGTTAAPPTCTPNPASVTPTASGASFTLTASSNAGQSYSFNLVATGTDASHVTHTVQIIFNSIDFSVSATPGSQTIQPGQTANFVLHVVPVGGNFLANVSFSCTGLPALAACAFNPASIASGSGATDIALAITTTGPNLPGFQAIARTYARFLLLCLPLVVIVLGSRLRSVPQRRATTVLMIVVGVTELALLQACGGGASTGGGNPPPPSTVSVSISPAAASVAISQNKQFQASVFGSTDTRVTWQVNSTPGGNPTIGTIDGNGMYIAPAAVPNPAVVSVVAVSVADSTKNASAAVNVTSSASVTISPSTASVPLGGTQQFTAAVAGVSNHTVRWAVNGKSGGDAVVGTIDANGLYTAPASIPNPPTVTVTAISQADWRQTASAKVSIASVAIAITPTSASVFTNGNQQFTARVSGTTNPQVSWNVNGTPGGNAITGTVDGTGLYTAPAAVPNPATVSVGAVAQADPSKSASATVTVLPSTPFGTYTITVTASSGSISRKTTTTLKVVP